MLPKPTALTLLIPLPLDTEVLMLIRLVPLSRFGHDIAIEMQEGEVVLAHDILIRGTSDRWTPRSSPPATPLP